MRDFILGLAFMLSGCIVIYVARQYPTMASLQFGPSLFPSLIGGGFLIGGLFLSAKQVPVLKAQYAANATERDRLLPIRPLLASLLPCVMIVFYIITSEFLGAAVSLAIGIFALMLFRKASLLLSFVVSILASLIIYFIFSTYLLIPLPEGLMRFWG
ncbi:tripartite tricarboxylate transporter TctB family protein [Halomonas denitrificans]|uniref:tripartite tricarboxylate transporter TctB family protein n=1 Tax=Halomonas TaxID=2745 RepID=UPI001C9719B9|nr:MULTISPECIES: tripartite tricarboxylate transporter TctB family protein [Halomonas]MBY6031248.1 tripartite tricarboxylate transporter TctB family protein [Halomonas sp. DP8Y7-1]MCA0974110.1 tripartite tricarboxylate transporter TctB family protein [Halomonas denitrificans]